MFSGFSGTWSGMCVVRFWTVTRKLTLLRMIQQQLGKSNANAKRDNLAHKTCYPVNETVFPCRRGLCAKDITEDNNLHSCFGILLRHEDLL